MPNPTSPTGDDDTSLSSTIEQAGAAGASPDASGAAGSSAADDDKGANPPELDLEAVVRKAAQEASPDAAATPADGKGNEGDEPAKGEADDQLTDAEKAEAAAQAQAEADAKLPFHKHPRWQEVLKERDTFRGERDSFKAQVDELSGKAETLDSIGGFMRDNALTPQEVQRGFEIMALMKHDPAAALEKLAPHIDALSLVTGRKLPSDLQEKVDAGEVTPEVAQQAARDRMAAQAAQKRVEHTEQVVQQDRVQQVAGAMKTAVEGWENDVKARDPDYPLMQSFVVDRTKALMRETPPRTADEAVALTKRAYSEVKAQMRKVTPPKAAVRTVTTDKSSTTAAPAPSSLEDVVRGALRQ